MGIKGLMTFCKKDISRCSEKVDLVHLAKQRDGVVLLVDFYAFEYMVMDYFWSSMIKISGNNYLPFDGGEYGSLDSYLSKFITALKDVGLELEFFVDGASGSSDETVRRKFKTWKKRHTENVKKVHQVVEMTKGNILVEHLSHQARITPVLLEVQIQATLKACGCKIHYIPCGEADFVIAKELNSNDKAVAILSDDSDFLVFPGGRLICKDTFDIKGDLKLGRANALLVPSKLICNVLQTEKVSACLQLTHPSQMIELSILAGNDFTSPFLQGGIYQALGLPRNAKLPVLARWVREHKEMDKDPTLKREMERKVEFKEAVQHSHKFYNLTLEEDHYSEDLLFNLLHDGIAAGEFPPPVMEMHRSFFWRKLMPEDTEPGHPSSEDAMVGLRCFIYRLLLPKEKESVTEHGRTQGIPYIAVEICAASEEKMKNSPLCMAEDIQENLKQFHHIMSHLEHGVFKKTWFDQYGRKNGFIFYILRYFLVLNWNYNLRISQNEFLALVAMVFGPRNEKSYQQLAIRPSTRCVTIGNWFQNINRHAYFFLGKLLHLADEFPLPREIFSGSGWTAFYTCCTDEEWQTGLRQVDRDALMQCKRDMDSVIMEKRPMIRNLSEHVFSFDG